MRLRFHHDLTQEEIGQRIGASKQYAGRVLAKGLEVLRLCMKEQRA
jgi:DNA-directed RNA polymerase specialized sigma subunit